MSELVILPPTPSKTVTVGSATSLGVPTLVEEAGSDARRRFVEFFTASIRNKNTRAAYMRAAQSFMAWADGHDLTLESIEPVHVAAYIEGLSTTASTATVKQHLAAIRSLFDYLVVGQIIPFNPAHAVRGPKLSRQTGTTPVLSADQARLLLDRPDPSTLPGLRDRAMIALMLYSFARVSAVVSMKVADYYPTGGKNWMIRLSEKGGKERRLPLHHEAEERIDAWLDAAGIRDEKRSPLFRALDRSGQLTDRPLARQTVSKMIGRHAEAAGIIGVSIGCHSMRGTGITAFLKKDGTLETAQALAGHADIKTTKLYDRRSSEIERREVERIQF